MTIQSITVLGATGSIGVSTLDVVQRHPDRYRIFALTGHSRIEQLAQQCRQFNPRYAVVGDADSATVLQGQLSGLDTEVLYGEQALSDVSAATEVDIVMAAIVGAAGLVPTLAAARAGKRLLLANKEALVMSGDLLTKAVAASGATLLPIDSEHNAIFQCLPTAAGDLGAAGVSKILLSASGGPFRTWSAEQIAAATPDQACAHPNWSMGRKISVDSATLMNKGLELIEACYLFAVSPDQIDVVVHPQSIIHSLVQYVDGSVLAQLGNPDMRTPIAHALAWPERIAAGVAPLNLFDVARLDFEAPDLERFPALALAMAAAKAGGSSPCVLNAANERAVAAFLAGRIGFSAIPSVVDYALARAERVEPVSLEAVQHSDQQARRLADQKIEQIP